jgi:cystathionine beta-lyase/cystathionine gamma-synthase
VNAISSLLLTFLSQGDHLVGVHTACLAQYSYVQIAQRPLYSGTQNFIHKYLLRFGVEVTWVPTSEGVPAMERAIKSNTKVQYTFRCVQGYV